MKTFLLYLRIRSESKKLLLYIYFLEGIILKKLVITWKQEFKYYLCFFKIRINSSLIKNWSLYTNAMKNFQCCTFHCACLWKKKYKHSLTNFGFYYTDTLIKWKKNCLKLKNQLVVYTFIRLRFYYNTYKPL